MRIITTAMFMPDLFKITEVRWYIELNSIANLFHFPISMNQPITLNVMFNFPG